MPRAAFQLDGERSDRRLVPVVQGKAQEFGQGRFPDVDEGWRDARCSQFTDVEGREVPGGDEEIVLDELTDRSPEVGSFALLQLVVNLPGLLRHPWAGAAGSPCVIMSLVDGYHHKQGLRL
jgi:hypothetical protein